jgi:hypothetical protein
VILIASDQNFVPIWPGTEPDSCVAVLRIENAYLHELVDTIGEIFSGVRFPEGSVFLLGDISYLHRVGLTQFTVEWCQVVGRVGTEWPGVRLCPLIPLIRSDVPGGVTRDVIEITAWVYDGVFLGLRDCWSKASQLYMYVQLNRGDYST